MNLSRRGVRLIQDYEGFRSWPGLTRRRRVERKLLLTWPP